MIDPLRRPAVFPFLYAIDRRTSFLSAWPQYTVVVTPVVRSCSSPARLDVLARGVAVVAVGLAITVVAPAADGRTGSRCSSPSRTRRAASPPDRHARPARRRPCLRRLLDRLPARLRDEGADRRGRERLLGRHVPRQQGDRRTRSQRSLPRPTSARSAVASARLRLLPAHVQVAADGARSLERARLEADATPSARSSSTRSRRSPRARTSTRRRRGARDVVEHDPADVLPLRDPVERRRPDRRLSLVDDHARHALGREVRLEQRDLVAHRVVADRDLRDPVGVQEHARRRGLEPARRPAGSGTSRRPARGSTGRPAPAARAGRSRPARRQSR